jgi:hypothetical protein
MVFTATPSTQKRLLLATLRRLSHPQRTHHTRPVSRAAHSRLFAKPSHPKTSRKRQSRHRSDHTSSRICPSASATTAELIYGQTLRLPGEFFNPSKSRLSDPEFIQQFRKLMNDLRPTPTSSHGNKQIFAFRDLETCSHVFLRHDAVKPPLQPAYDGPYKVLRRDHRTFRLLLNGRPTSVSTDRLKPAYVANEDPPQPTITPSNTATNTTDTNTKQTRSGRNIQRPVRFRDHPAGRGVM